MYAETFSVRPWLEEPAKWCRWAQQSSVNGNQGDARYNLEQFWKSLEPIKAQARTALDWSEVLTLDAQSHIFLAQIMVKEQRERMIWSAEYSAVKETAYDLMPPLKWLEWARQKAFEVGDPNLSILADQVAELGKQAEAANATGQALAKQAVTARDQAMREDNTVKEGQENRTAQLMDWDQQKIQTGNQNAAATMRRIQQKDAQSPLDRMGNPFTFQVLGLPVWAWGAVALGVVLLLVPAVPRVTFSTSSR